MDRNNSNDRTTAGVIAAIAIIASIALLVLAGLTGSICAAIDENAGGREGEVTGAAVSAASVTTSINYQGRLTDDAGEPLSGTYEMMFGLYDVSTGGTVLDTDTHMVDVADGLFGTGIDFDQSYFDGSELWLGVTVKPDSEMTPRQELRPVPYALSLVPGANIIGSAFVALHAESTHTSGKGISGYATATSGANYGVYGASMSADGAGVYARGIGSGADLILGGNAVGGVGDDGKIYSDPAYASSDIYLVTNDGLRIDLDNDGDGEDADFEIRDKNGTLIFNVDESSGVYSHATATTGSNNHGVRAYSDYGYGVYGKGKYGGYFTTNQGGTSRYDCTAGVKVTTAHNHSAGVRVSTTGSDSDGVYTRTTGDGSYGVHAATTGDNSSGVYAYSFGDNSDAVYAYSTKGSGVYGKGKYGGYFTTNQGGTSWDNRTAGVNVTTTYDYSEGVRVYTTGYNSDGVCASTTGDYSEGVCASTTGDDSSGVRASTAGDYSEGVYASTTGYYSAGVRASTTGVVSAGVDARSAKSYGVYGRSDSTDSAGVYARGKDSGADLILGGNADTVVGDDGKIYSDPAYASSDIYLVTNDGLRIDLDNDGSGEDADFEIRDKNGTLIFNVDESGDVTYGGPNIAAFPRPAYDSGWASINKDSTKTLTHNLGGNPDNYVVDLQFKSESGRSQSAYGGDCRLVLGLVPVNHGAEWHSLNDERIKVYRWKDDIYAKEIRVRIWVYT